MTAKPLCTPLPDPFFSGLHAPDEDIAQFFKDRVNQSDRNEVTNEFKKTLVLEAQRSRRVKARKPRVSKKQLTAREKRDLGLARLPKVGLKYQQFQELHSLWSEYMADLLDVAGLQTSGWAPGNLEEPRVQQLQMKVCRADLHGAKLTVEKADCSTQVGRQGVCLMETKHTFQIISTDEKLRMIPKKGTTFSVEVGGFKFSFPGSSLVARPAERATKKPKLKMPLDF